MTSETSTLAPTKSLHLEEILRRARENGDEELVEYTESLMAIVADVVPVNRAFPVHPGESIYAKANFCTTCGRIYPKEVRMCRPCRRKVRSKPRS